MSPSALHLFVYPSAIVASLLRSAQGAKSAALQDELDREGLNGDGIAKSLVVYRKLVRVGVYREGPAQSSVWIRCYRSALDSFLQGRPHEPGDDYVTPSHRQGQSSNVHCEHDGST